MIPSEDSPARSPPTHQADVIIERDYTAEWAVHFQEDFPPELQDKVMIEQSVFMDFINSYVIFGIYGVEISCSSRTNVISARKTNFCAPFVL